MNFDENKYIKRQLKKNSNKNYLLIYMTIFIIMFVCTIAILTFSRMSIYYKHSMYDLLNYNVIAEDGNYESLNKIDHIEEILDAKDYGATYPKDKDMQFSLFSVFNVDDIKISSGRNIENDNEMICNSNFYPYDPYEGDYFKIDKSRVIKPSELIGQKFTFSSENKKDDNLYEVTVVGTYKNNKLHGNMATCYVTPNLLSKLRDECQGYEGTESITGYWTYKCIPFEGKAIRIDATRNIKKVKDELTKMGYRYYQYYETDSSMLDLFLFGTTFAIIIVLFLSMIILDTYLKKKINFRKKQYGILKTIGFDEDKIVAIELKESTFLLIISFILSIIIFTIGFMVFREVYLQEFAYEGFKVNLPLLLIFIVAIIIISLARLLISRKLKRVMKMDAMNLLKG